MDKAQILSILNQIEAKYPVDAWKINDISVWPILRIRLAERLFKYSQNTGHSPSASRLKKKSVFQAGQHVIKSLMMVPVALWKLRRSGTEVNQVYLASGIHRTWLPHGWFSRFADPLIAEDQALGGKSILLEFDSPLHYPAPRVHEPWVVAMQGFSPLAYLAGKLYHQLASVSCSLPQYEGFLEYLSSEGVSSIAEELSISALAYRTLVVELYSRFFRKWLQRYRPTCVLVVSYYSLEAMALCDAAYRLGIPTVDIQHGIQGPLHTSYAQWNKVPSMGYSLLPQVFWTWNKSSALTIQLWSKAHSYHRTFVGGNPWLTYWQKGLSDTQAQSLLTSLPDNMVLYSLQPVSPRFPPWLVEAIRATKEDYQWWVRLHPRQLSEQKAIMEELEALGLLDFVNLHEATTLPLFTLLARTRVHITQWSTVIWEAAAFGVPSVAIHPTGKDLFKDQLPENILYCAYQADELIHLIRQLSSHKSAPMSMNNNNQQSLLKLRELLSIPRVE